ncbi:hypothetical protein FS837_007533, partial [Tulasnella sp. UAMH 9824]
RDKLNKLERWRIDPFTIEFPENARAFRGGSAVVSRAFLTIPRNAEEKSGYHADERPDPGARTSEPKDYVPESLGHQNNMNRNEQNDKTDLEGDNGGEVGNDHDYGSPRHESGAEAFERV